MPAIDQAAQERRTDVEMWVLGIWTAVEVIVLALAFMGHR